MPTPSARDHLRAGLLAALLLSHGLVALPLGPRVTAKSIAEPRAQREVDGWMALAGPLGFSREGFIDTVIAGSDLLVSTDRRVVGPMAKRWKLLGIGQAWALFAVPIDTPRTLEVSGIDAQGRHLLYRRHDPEHAVLADVFGYRRVRGVYDRGKRTRSYRELATWTAATLMAQDPGLVSVEMLQRERLVGAPGEVEHPRPKPTLRHTIARDGLEGLGATEDPGLVE